MNTPAESPVAELPNRREALAELDSVIPTLGTKTRTALAGVDKIWQPQDFLPDFSKQELAFSEIQQIQRQAKTLSPELLTVLIGDTVTEDGLPLFTSRLFTMQGLPSATDGDVHAHKGNLQKWIGQWTGEEHRHGDLLKSYLQYTGRVDMAAFQRTVQLFLEDGLDIQTGNDPYKGFVYTSFQELATQTSHANVARLAQQSGDHLLAKICGQIASDENYHAKAYIEFVRLFFQRDPNAMMVAMKDMFEQGIVMPAHNMREVETSGRVQDPGEMYGYFSSIAQKIGVYTAKDYARISGHLIGNWGVGKKKDEKWEAQPMTGLTEEGLQAQDDILRRQSVIERIASRDRNIVLPDYQTSWLVSNAQK